MHFSRSDSFYHITRITGPTHNFLALDIAEHNEAVEPAIEQLPPHGECRHAALDQQRILEAAVEGVEQANKRFGTRFVVRTVRYVANDTGPERVYALLALKIVERIHTGGSFEHTGARHHV